METILVVGATGNIGVSAVQAALHSKRKVLAIVRNQESAEKLFKYSGTKEGITIVEADVTADNGVQGVVDQVKAGKLPAFQHVFTCGEFSQYLYREFTNRRFSWWKI
jgi:NAD(P)-dependent dehydrogenase (short-subunit alcohol dehydrogenase family)